MTMLADHDSDLQEASKLKYGRVAGPSIYSPDDWFLGFLGIIGGRETG